MRADFIKGLGLPNLRSFWRDKIISCIPFLFSGILRRSLGKGRASILDIGCGTGEPLSFLSGQKGLYVVGVDTFEPYLKGGKQKKVYDDLILGDIRELPIRTKSFDTVLCLNVVEHLEKEEGKRLVKEMQEIAKTRVILLTPNGFIAKPAHNGNPCEIHKSAWSPKEFKEDGFVVRGLRFSGLKGLDRLLGVKDADRAIFKVLKRGFRLFAQIITGLLPWLSPKLGRTLFCTKGL